MKLIKTDLILYQIYSHSFPPSITIKWTKYKTQEPIKQLKCYQTVGSKSNTQNLQSYTKTQEPIKFKTRNPFFLFQFHIPFSVKWPLPIIKKTKPSLPNNKANSSKTIIITKSTPITTITKNKLISNKYIAQKQKLPLQLLEKMEKTYLPRRKFERGVSCDCVSFV